MSWWEGLNREQFNERAAIEQARMKVEKLHSTVSNYFAKAEHQEVLVRRNMAQRQENS